MSFGGGNTSSGVSAHVHNNDTGEGGALEADKTLLDSSILYTRIIVGA
tara:strand:- start:261 stop:404 length:144 start_codon:yes stop_codon:yes gene_type:complete